MELPTGASRLRESSRGSRDLQNKGSATAGLVCEGQNDMESRELQTRRAALAAREGGSGAEPLGVITRV